MLKAVLLDIGGPINDETVQEEQFDDAVLTAAREIRDVSAEEYVDICRRAVESFAPRAYRFIMWELAGHDREQYAAIRDHVQQSGFEHFCVRAEIPGLLEPMSRTYKLGIAANSGAAMLDRLAEASLLEYFSSRKPGAVVGMDKPDTRYFELLMNDLDARPEETAMVGDRIDCDMVPARMLGIKAVLYRVGRHAGQQPRSSDEVPDAEIQSMNELPEVLQSW